MGRAIEIRRGELLADRPELRLELVADTPWLSMSHGTLGAGGPTPPAHVHREHADCFLVLEGGLRLALADGERTVEGESWVQVPAGVVHTFAPVERVRILNVHAPSAGYRGFIERLARAAGPEDVYRAREGFDQHDPPEGGGLDPGAAVAVQLGGDGGVGSTEPPGSPGAGVAGAGAGRGEPITDRPERRVTLLADTSELAVTESVYTPGERGPDPHVHYDHADAFVVLEGTLTFTLRGASLQADAGTILVVPPVVVHSFANDHDTDARFLNLHAPSCGFGDYLRGRYPGFDQHEPPADGGGDPATVVATRLAD
jgi:mannose-6-phosphate isomerase-like protein (cupin superfamily)